MKFALRFPALISWSLQCGLDLTGRSRMEKPDFVWRSCSRCCVCFLPINGFALDFPLQLYKKIYRCVYVYIYRWVMSLVCTPQATWVEHGFVHQAFPSIYEGFGRWYQASCYHQHSSIQINRIKKLGCRIFNLHTHDRPARASLQPAGCRSIGMGLRGNIWEGANQVSGKD